MPYPEQPYQVAAIATYPGGFEMELVEYGNPCTEAVQDAGARLTKERGARYCGQKPTYLQGGVPRCKDHLSQLCIHGQYSHMLCGQYNEPIKVRRLREPRPQTSSS